MSKSTTNHNQAVLEKVIRRKKANNVINKFHAGQKRKDGEDFVNHPIRVGKIISECIKHSEDAENCYIAGLLHDTIEDTDYTEKELLTDFGEEIHEIVMQCTEDKTKTWKERKEHTIEYLDKISLPALIVTLADKIDNLNSLAETVEQEKITIEELFKTRFNSPIENQKWYYSEIYLKSLLFIFSENKKLAASNFNISHFTKLLRKYKTAIHQVFGLFSGDSYLEESTKNINRNNYIPILMNRNIDEDTNINQIQFAEKTIDGKNYYIMYESWYWDGIWGHSIIFISKQFEGLSEEERNDLIIRCLDFKNEENIPKKKEYTVKDKGWFTFFNYGFYTGS